MDWRDLLDERNRRASQGYSGFTLPTRNVATTSAAPEEDDGGFFGGIGRAFDTAKNVVGEVGSFFGNMAEDIYEAGETAVTGITDVIQGQAASNKMAGNSEELNKHTREWKKYMDGLSDTDYDKPEVQAKLQEFSDKAKQIQSQVTDDDKREIAESQAVDPVKTGAAAAETFLNVATAGVGGIAKNAGKQVLKQGAKTLGREVVEDVAPSVARQALSNRTAGGAAQTIGRGMAEGGLFGAGYGALQPYTDEGAEADPYEALQGALMGGTIGGALGGAIPLLSKDVRAGVREMPGAVRRGAGEVAEQARQFTPSAIAARDPRVLGFDDQYAQLAQRYDNTIDEAARRDISRAMALNRAERASTVRSLTEGGYIRLPGGGPLDEASDAADLARRQLDGENISGASDDFGQRYINETVASYGSPEEFVDDTVNRIWNQNREGKGVTSWLTEAGPGEGSGYTGRQTMSNNDPFYQAFYREYGRPPSRKAIRDMVEQRLTGRPGEYNDILTDDVVSPYDSDIYRLLVDREAGFTQTMADGPPADLYSQFAGDIGAPVAPGSTVTAPRPVGTTAATQTGDEASSALERTLGRPDAPYEGMTQDLTRPALPTGELPKPLTPAQAKRTFKTSGEAKDFVNRQRAGQKPINLPATSEDLSQVATRTTPKGGVAPIKNGSSYVAKDVMEGVKELQQQSHRFRKISPMTDLNTINEQLTREIGGVQSKAGQVLESLRQKVQSADAKVVQFNNNLRKMVRDEAQTYNFSDEQWFDVNKWLNQQKDPAARASAFNDIVTKHGEDVAAKAQAMFDEWSPRMRQAMEAYNEKVVSLGYKDRVIGDLGEFYWPRVYKQASFKDKATDVAGSIIDLKGSGLDKTGFNPNTMSGSTTASNMALPGQGRAFNQAPIGSEFSRPTVGFTGHAKSRTAASPVQEQVNPLEAVTKYLESVNAITVNTDAVHDIRGVQQAIKALQKETGDNTITILNDVLDNVANPLLGKTNEIDRSLQKYWAGQKALEWGGFLSKQLSRSQLLGSVRTIMAQTGQIPLLTAEVGTSNAAKGIRMLFSREFDDLMAQSDFLVSNKFMGNEAPFAANTLKQLAQKGERVAGWGMDASAAAMAKATWAGAYLKGRQAGLTGKALIKEADRITGKVVGNRAAGLRPSLYESRAAQGLAMYTLDINQMYQATKGYIGEKNYKALGTLLGAAWAYNLLYEGISGEPLVADPIRATTDAAGILASDRYLDSDGNPIGIGEKLFRAGGRLTGEGLAYAPLGNVAGGIYPEQGLKLPFSGDRTLSRSELFGDSSIGRYGPSAPLTAAFENPLYLLGIPGTGQAQRTFQGLQAVNEGESVTPSGRQRFEVEGDLENYIRALIFGQYQTREGRQYIEELSRQARGESAPLL